MIMVAGFSFLGEGLRESLDVKLRPHILIRGRGLENVTTSRPKRHGGASQMPTG
jgi:hypothetical protein